MVKPLSVAWFPQSADLAGNPYWPLLEQALSGLGVQFVSSHNSYWLARRWLFQQRNQLNIIHFHFIQPHYNAPTLSKIIRRLMKFSADLQFARLLGYRLVWTLHDLYPTWPIQPRWLDTIGRYIIAHASDHVIVHCEKARELLAQQFHRRHHVWTIPHAGFSRPMIPMHHAREQLGLPQDAWIISFAGGIRPNKGIEALIHAFSQFPPPNAILIIVGKRWPPEEYTKRIELLAQRDTRIQLMIDSPQFDSCLFASNIACFPFQEILTSSSVLFAMSAGLPVVVPNRGCLPELVGNEMGFIYHPEQPEQLLSALSVAYHTNNLAEMGKNAKEYAQHRTWAMMAEETLRVYRA